MGRGPTRLLPWKHSDKPFHRVNGKRYNIVNKHKNGRSFEMTSPDISQNSAPFLRLCPNLDTILAQFGPEANPGADPV